MTGAKQKRIPRSRTAAPDADTEAKILAAARRVFTAKGTAGARMQDIAKEAGVNQALLHYYFRSKAALSERVFLEAAGRLVQIIPTAFRDSATLEEMVTTFVHGYIDTVREAPFLPGYVLAELHHDPTRMRTLVQRLSGRDPQAVVQQGLARVQRLLGTRLNAEQFLLNLMALSAFPFVARPVLNGILGQDEAAFAAFLDERRRTLPTFILNAISR